jgi:hypothetical protein
VRTPDESGTCSQPAQQRGTNAHVHPFAQLQNWIYHGFTSIQCSISCARDSRLTRIARRASRQHQRSTPLAWRHHMLVPAILHVAHRLSPGCRKQTEQREAQRKKAEDEKAKLDEAASAAALRQFGTGQVLLNKWT